MELRVIANSLNLARFYRDWKWRQTGSGGWLFPQRTNCRLPPIFRQWHAIPDPADFTRGVAVNHSSQKKPAGRDVQPAKVAKDS
jgi:hypothetical protein